jgi:hypothetical protein
MVKAIAEGHAHFSFLYLELIVKLMVHAIAECSVKDTHDQGEGYPLKNNQDPDNKP